MSAVPSATAAASHATLEARVARFPARQVELASQRVLSYREACETSDALPLVLLHGIGSGAASWVQQFEALSASRRVLAWDAPGYGESTAVPAASPAATDYANVLYEWLEKLGIERCVLVGHSLGAIIAGSFAAMHPQRVAGLLLLSPAGGYGAASAEVRETKRDQRLAMLNELGPQGLAEKRSANMLSAHASDEARAWVRWNMSRVIPHGYARATHLLANADLASDLARLKGRYNGRLHIAVGADDTITTPAACERLALAADTQLQVVPRAGHAGYIEASAAYTAIIDTFCRASAGQRSQ
ncbi:2-succinyl-6-hydroxy-2, 4-cyclohexadiene-1-carboxylate synthase [Paraburkholderia graminis C4D1M]|jgi:pimeloyl-ACP methyl ester carboxylesterase|uniref:Alpha/beta hydrolase fold n=1 Tax=Paraburkholderia graminis (strain ATCC 700544 / DSM 17151 / LMG 18924 / NCIMB 13744 / C4D1M) TaxID=396598 RepID=B1FUU7_PARG4|nr:alpha/beta fold hydrolase [Paraburkholderia graminis]EDT12252.1 alpha/beta hydrolase fold [Paraburkholderia graminis C4D1M]CAB3720861.1 2-succinyl-6-hydroxy-2, 4-cyclohexadiene-1-carboxylate synthase [Paraburkholderia graminis C4D1M]